MMTAYKFAWIEFEAVYYTLPTYIYIHMYICHTYMIFSGIPVTSSETCAVSSFFFR